MDRSELVKSPMQVYIVCSSSSKGRCATPESEGHKNHKKAPSIPLSVSYSSASACQEAGAQGGTSSGYKLI